MQKNIKKGFLYKWYLVTACDEGKTSVAKNHVNAIYTRISEIKYP